MKRLIFALCAFAFSFLFFSIPVRAQFVPVYTVNTTADNVVAGACTGGAACSLRAAIQAANSVSDSIINFSIPFCDFGCVINLTQALPNITRSVTIDGPGAGNLTVRRDTGGGYRIFTVTAPGTVSFTGLTISNGGFGGAGGGIQNVNAGTVNVINCVLSRNFADGGGGISNAGTLTVTNSTLSGNEAVFGGAISNTGTLNVINSTLSGNATLGE